MRTGPKRFENLTLLQQNTIKYENLLKFSADNLNKEKKFATRKFFDFREFLTIFLFRLGLGTGSTPDPASLADTSMNESAKDIISQNKAQTR